MLLLTTASLMHWNPYEHDIWGTSRNLGLDDVHLAVSYKKTVPPDVPDNMSDSIITHARRVAWFVINGWLDPVEIDVGVPELNCFVDWPIQDGHHRIAAAIYRGDKLIKANVDGSNDLMLSLFNVNYFGEGDQTRFIP